jgi:hypothetical protein
MTMPWTRYAIAVLAVALCGSAMGQLSTVNAYDRCLNDSSAFAVDEKLNEVVTEYLANIQREIDSSVDISRVAGMAGLKDRSLQARLRADQYLQELRQACAHISQSMNATDERPKVDQIAPVQNTQTAERQRQASIEYELNRRVSGATFLMNEAGFARWLDGKQGKSLRRDAWDKAILAESYERAAQMLRDYEGTLNAR